MESIVFITELTVESRQYRNCSGIKISRAASKRKKKVAGGNGMRQASELAKSSAVATTDVLGFCMIFLQQSDDFRRLLPAGKIQRCLTKGIGP